MKTKKTIIAVFILLSFFLVKKSSGSEKFKGDTLRIWFNEFMIEVNSVDLNKQHLSEINLSETAISTYHLLESVSVPKPENDETYLISISEWGGKLKLEYQNATFDKIKKDSKKIVFSKGKLLETDFGNYAVKIENIDFTLIYYLYDLADLSKISGDAFDSQISQAQKLIPANRKKVNGWLKWNGTDSFETYFLSESNPYTLDMLNLTAGVGAGVIKNQWVNDVNFKVGIGFAKKGIMRNAYFAEYKMYYDFSPTGENKLFSVNGFLSLGYEHNFSNNIDKEKWIGFSLGYLVDRKTEFFNKNTWRLSLQKRINQTISVSPELYFDGFFKNVYPGVQIGVSL